MLTLLLRAANERETDTEREKNTQGDRAHSTQGDGAHELDVSLVGT